MRNIKIFTAFSGYDSQCMALDKAGIGYELVGTSEVDKYAIVANDAVHGDENTPIPNWDVERKQSWLESRNIGFDYKKGKNTLKRNEVEALFAACVRLKNHGDVSLINPNSLGSIDLFTYSFPCQDISLAGKGKGLGKDTGTRSGLLWECLKIIKATKPRALMMENVKNLVGKKFMPDFLEWCKELEELGYKNYWQVLNAKDYGVPQNRERVFMFSLLGGSEYVFPEKEPLELRLKDILEDTVDDKFYLSEKIIKGFTAHKNRHIEKGTGFKWIPKDLEKDDVANCLRANAALCPTDNTIRVCDSIVGKVKSGGERSFVLDKNGITGSLSATDYKDPKKILEYDDDEVNQIIVKEATKKGYAIATVGDSINLEQPNSKTRRGRVGKGVAQTLTTSCNQDTLEPPFKIRKLTPLECFRLMGVTDEDFYKIKNRLNEVFHKGADRSNSQLYKLAGNSIVVDCMEKMFKKLCKK